MNKSDYPNPEEHIFYCDKSDWFTTDEEGKQDWSKSQDKVEEFWRQVRGEKMANLDYDFAEFVFPEFITENFWQANEEVHSKDDKLKDNNESDYDLLGVVLYEFVSIVTGTFKGLADFRGATFQGKARFQGVTFQDTAVFMGATFQHTTNFAGATFHGIVDNPVKVTT